MARMAKAGRQEPVVVLLDRGVSVAGDAAPEGLTAKRARPESNCSPPVLSTGLALNLTRESRSDSSVG